MVRKNNGIAGMDQQELIQKIELLQSKVKKYQTELFKKNKDKNDVGIFDQTITEQWSMYHGDCLEVIQGIPDDSIHYSIFSPPFLSLYVYSDDFRDMGNSKNDDEFYTHFEYLIPELLRVLMPGRLLTVHCSLVTKSIQHDGFLGLKDLPGNIVQLFEKHGFIYHSKVNVWKNPLIQATRTHALTLAHKQIIKDSTRCGQGFCDELLTFRKPGENPEPVSRERGFETYIGIDNEPNYPKNNDPKINKYSHHVWQRYASPVWMDVNQSDTLNVRQARDNKDERHICPLQLPVIARCLDLWTNENDIVLSPFAGIGSEGYESLKMDRKFIGIELKKSYYQTAIKNLTKIENRPTKLV